MFKSEKSVCLALAATLAAGAGVAVSPATLATVIASDGFAYSLGELNGQNGGSGWGGAWTALAPATQVVDPGVDLGDNRALQLTGNNDNLVYRPLASAYAGSELFVDFFIQIDAGSLTGNDFVSLWLDTITTGTHTTRPNIGIKSDGSGVNDVFVRTTGSAGSLVPLSDIGSINDVTHHIVGRLSKGAGNFNLYEVWLDPVIGDLGSPDAFFSADAGISQITQVGFRTANLDPGDTVLLDNLQLSTTWNEALRVSEPASLALLGLGVLAGLGRLRRKEPS